VNTLLLFVICAVPLIGLVVFMGTSQKRREARAMRDFAATLDGGVFEAGTMARGPRASGRWKGVEVSVAFFGRLEPPVFLTAVTAARRRSPVAALLVPRTERRARGGPPSSAPDWIRRLDRTYDAGCAPAEAFRVVLDEETAESLSALSDTELEILPSNVNVKRREIVYEARQLVSLLDVAELLVRRLETVHDELVGPTKIEELRRAGEVTSFLSSFRN
jgi:hypothetical protein